jgi:hypothetical protein
VNSIVALAEFQGPKGQKFKGPQKEAILNGIPHIKQ